LYFFFCNFLLTLHSFELFITCLLGPVTNVLLVTPKRVNLPPLQSLRKVCSANGGSESRAVIVPQPENDVQIFGNFSSDFLERCLDALQVS
jgi:pre-rRNA-processing protein IPI3